MSKSLGKCQNIFHLKVLFENVWINSLFIPAVLVATEESNFSLKKLQVGIQSLNSLLPWCVRSCNRHTRTRCSTMCWEEALTLSTGPVSGFGWMRASAAFVIGYRGSYKSLSPFTYRSCLQTSCLQIIMWTQVLFKELPRTLYILPCCVALPLAHPQLLNPTL